MIHDVDNFLTLMEVRTGKKLNEQQRELARDFTRSTIGFADPGTGKTFTAVFGLITAELFHKVPGDKIYALSFTRMATMELKNRHEDICETLKIKSKPTFKTLHALCKQILIKNKHLLGMKDLEISSSMPVSKMGTYLIEAAEEKGIKVNPYKIRNLVNAIRTLNSALIFDRAHVESKKEFKVLNLSYEDFTELRKGAYTLNKINESIQMSDVLLYTLDLLLRNPKVSEDLKKECKVLLIDECQDMSLLQLKLASLISDNLVVIGDMKQQIFGFNGACPEIVSNYFKLYPEAREANLFQSYRCSRQIAEFAKKLIKPNKMGGDDFTGFFDAEPVNLVEKLDIQDLCKKLKDEFIENNNRFEKDVMFLTRSNVSLIPIIENLYQNGLLFRANNYKAAHTIPVIEDLMSLIECVRNPNTPDGLDIIHKVLPEFRSYKGGNKFKSPLYKIMTDFNRDIFQLNYNFKDPSSANLLFDTLLEVKTLYEKGSVVSEMMKELWSPYYNLYLNEEEFKLEQPAEYYINQIMCLSDNKTYEKFVKDELNKLEIIESNNKQRNGIRCYTFHAAKGLEANRVFIIDADRGLIPNEKKIKETLKEGCAIDAAREIRNERCLVFVACTRAIEELTISYNSELSSLFTTTNEYDALDRMYSKYKEEFNDVEIFLEFSEEKEYEEGDNFVD